MVYWFRSKNQITKNGSFSVEKFEYKAYPVINQNICWLPGRGTQIFLGIDPIIGLSDGYKLEKELILELHGKNLFVLTQVNGQSVGGKDQMAIGKRFTVEFFR